MKIKGKLDLGEDELINYLESKVKTLNARVAKRAGHEARRLARTHLSSSLSIWQKGFKVIHRSDTEWVLTIEGELANMIEEKGINPGEIGNMIMKAFNQGKKAPGSTTKGKDYIDVPITTKKPSSGAVNAENLQERFSVKSFSFRDLKAGKTQEEERLYKIVKDAENNNRRTMVSKKTERSNPVYIQFFRLTKDTQNRLPNSRVNPKKIFEMLETKIDGIFEEEFRKL